MIKIALASPPIPQSISDGLYWVQQLVNNPAAATGYLAKRFKNALYQ